MNVGFIGLGIMGTPMAANLVSAGHSLQVFDLRPVPASLTEKGVGSCGSGREVAERSDVIITMVPDTPHVEAALFGKSGVAEGLARGKTVIVASHDPMVVQSFPRVFHMRDGVIERAG